MTSPPTPPYGEKHHPRLASGLRRLRSSAIGPDRLEVHQVRAHLDLARTARQIQTYVPRLLIEWLTHHPDRQHLAIHGSLAFVDIAGFTKLTERLARKGKIGAEEMSDVLDSTFGALLRAAQPDGADLVKWGGDAILLLFRGPRHAEHAARAAYRMRKTLRAVGRVRASAGAVVLRMSVGIHSGEFHFFLVGDPSVHRELVVTGPAASRAAEFEAIATAGQIAVSDEAVALMPAGLLGAPVPGGRLLRSEPHVADIEVAPPQTERLDLARALPRAIREHLLGSEGVSEHRQVAVAFIEFSGTDGLLVESGPGAVTSALDEFVRNVQRATEHHDVTFLESDINRDGGKVMLVSGAPRSQGSHEERMLRTVRQIIDHAGVFGLRAGVNRGPVFAGDFGPAFRRTYSVKGDAVNLAARVMARATAGSVVATRDVAARSRTTFESEELAPFLVKGKSQAVHALTIGAVRGERAEDLSADVFVGRERELAALATALADARHGRGSLVEVIGEPGMGKSRLAQETRQLADQFVTVEGPSGSYHSNTAYYPFDILLRTTLGLGADADRAAITQRLIARVRESAPQLSPWLSLLAAVLGADMPSSREIDELDERFRRAKVEEVTSEFLRHVLPTPSLLVFENVHLMDDASADLLAQLAAEVSTQPWVILVTRRALHSGFVPDPDDGHVRLPLAAIDDTAAAALLESVAGSTPLTLQATQAIAAKAGGNPLFLRALLLAASRSGSITDLPDSVEGVVTSQIDRLDPRDRDLLRYAAVLGVEFSLPALQLMLAARGQRVDDEALRRVGDFIESAGDIRRRFRHAVIRDVAYSGLPYRLRRQMHEQVGRALEQGDHRDDLVDQLSMHFFHAGKYEEAWRYSRDAADRARDKYAHAEALEFLERALECRSHARGIQPAQVAALYEQLGDIRDIAGLSAEAADAYHRARAFVQEDQVMVANLMFKEASIAQRIGKFSASLRLLSRGRRLLDGASGPDVDAARSRLATRYSFGKYLQGKYDEATRWSAIGADEARRAGDNEALAYAYNTMHLAYMHAGRAEEEPYGELALAVYEEIGNLRMQGHCLNNLAIGALQDGRWDLSSQLLQRAAGMFQRVGDTANEANSEYNRADLLIRQGRYTEAAPLLRAALRAARAVDDHELVALVLREQGRTLMGLGRFEEATARFDDARPRFVSLGLPRELIALDAAQAECLMFSGRLDDALSLASAALDRARALRTSALVSVLLRIQAFALLVAGRHMEAGRTLEAGLQSSDRADGQYERALMLMALARTPDMGSDAESRALRQESEEILDRLGVVAVPSQRLLDGA
jgi:class 3 adenylate cyclase/tetratricopeptide (TPR) repeat protein